MTGPCGCYCMRCRPLVVARYDGMPCPACGHRVLAGDDITTLDGARWWHEECGHATEHQPGEAGMHEIGEAR